MDLFGDIEGNLHNMLPYDGEVYYYGVQFSVDKADAYFSHFIENIAWKHDEAIIMGKKITTKRMIAWYGDKSYSYHYSKLTREALPWTSSLLELKQIIEQRTNETYNSCLMNLYHNGEEGVAWHSDGEKALKRNGTIASLSLGAVRKFKFKHKKTKEIKSLTLEHGALLTMGGTTQTHWLHTIPTTKTIKTPRISLTFRTITE